MKLGLVFATLAGGLAITGCSSYQIARDVKLMSLTSEPSAKEKSVGSIEGKSCQWSVFGWPLGEKPTIRSAFSDAQLGTNSASAGKQLSVLRDVQTESDFLGLYVVSRACVKVQGLGAI